MLFVEAKYSEAQLKTYLFLEISICQKNSVEDLPSYAIKFCYKNHIVFITSRQSAVLYFPQVLVLE